MFKFDDQSNSLQNQAQHWLTRAEDMLSEVDEDYIKSREYYEGRQSPSGQPKDKPYLVRNLVTENTHRKIAKMLGGKFEPVLYGGGMEEQVKELVLEIYEQNMFDQLYEEMIERFRVEGLTGMKIRYNPTRLGVFGLGFPEIFCMRHDQVLLDYNHLSGSHLFDKVRAYKYRMHIEEAKDKYSQKVKDGPGLDPEDITPYSNPSTQGSKTGKDELYVDVYETEFIRTYMWPHIPIEKDGIVVGYAPIPLDYKDEDDTVVLKGVRRSNGKRRMESFNQISDPYFQKRGLKSTEDYIKQDHIEIECPIVFRMDMLNKEKLGYGPIPLDHRGFTIIPCLNIRRESTGNTLPKSHIPDLIDAQDHMNTIMSIIHEVVQRSAKDPTYIIGATRSTIEAFKDKSIPGVNILIQQTDAKVEHPPQRNIPPQLIEYLNLNRTAFDEMSSDMPTERGAVGAELSGKAINLLQYTGDLSDEVAKAHVQNTLRELTYRTIEIIQNDMQDPFVIYRNIDGKTQALRFNTPKQWIKDKQFNEKDELVYIRKIKELDIVNPLRNAEFAKVDVEIEMNAIAKRNFELQKIQIFAEDLARIDRLRKAYPKEYRYLMDNKETEDEAVRFIQELSQLGPDALKVVRRYVGLIVNDPESIGMLAEMVKGMGVGGQMPGQMNQ